MTVSSVDNRCAVLDGRTCIRTALGSAGAKNAGAACVTLMEAGGLTLGSRRAAELDRRNRLAVRAQPRAFTDGMKSGLVLAKRDVTLTAVATFGHLAIPGDSAAESRRHASGPG